MSSDYTFCLRNPQFKQNFGRPPTTKRSNLPKPVHFQTIQQQEEPTDDVEEDRLSRKVSRVLSTSDILNQTLGSTNSKSNNLKSPSLKILNSACNQRLKHSGLTFGKRRMSGG